MHLATGVRGVEAWCDMDESAFDEVTRLVAAVGSRRALLAGVAASLALGEEAAGKQN